MPQVSIIIALHNKGIYIAETIRSVLAQSLDDWELIVVENGSTDNGPAVVRQFSDARVRLVMSPKQGPGAARNFGLEQAAGEWILFLDADDLIEPEYLAEQMAAAAKYPAARVIASSWQEFSDASPEHRELRHPSLFPGDPSRLADSAIAYAPWALHAALVRKDWFGNRVRWLEHLDGGPSEDTAFWFAVIQGAAVVWSESKGAICRVNTHNSRNSPAAASRWLEGLKQVIATNLDLLARLGQTPSADQRATIMRIFESRYRQELKAGNQVVAAQFLSEATRWLRSCSWNQKTIVFRKILGIKLASQFASLSRGRSV